MLWLSDAFGTRTLWWFEHGCSGYRTHSEHERYCGLSIDVLVIGRTRNSKDIVACAGMLPFPSVYSGNTNVSMV